MAANLNVGNDRAVLIDVLTQLVPFIGYPRMLNGLRMINETGPYRAANASAAGRVGTCDEIATAAAFLLGPDSGFITGTDLLIDGGVIAALHAGRWRIPGGGAN